MSIYEYNVKKTRKDSDGLNLLRCKCGSIKMEVKTVIHEDSAKILVYCKKCNKTLYFDGC